MTYHLYGKPVEKLVRVFPTEQRRIAYLRQCWQAYRKIALAYQQADMRLPAPQILSGEYIPMPSYSEQLNYNLDIHTGFAKALHVMAWARAWECAEEEGEVDDKPWSGGDDLMDIAPPATQAAWEAADHALATIQMDNKVNLSEEAPKGLEQTFGHYLAMEWLGSGVSWEDDHEPHGLNVGHGEFFYSDLDEAEDS